MINKFYKSEDRSQISAHHQNTKFARKKNTFIATKTSKQKKTQRTKRN